MSIILALVVLLSILAKDVKGAAQCTAHGCTLDNYFRNENGWIDRKPCKVSKLLFPTSEDELVRAVSEAVKHHQKIKVVSKGAHTISKFACPNSAKQADGGVLISTSKYNASIILDKRNRTVTCDSGVQLRALVDFLANEGFALTQTIYWDGVSVSGMVSTGAHGSTLWNKGGGTYEYLAGMRIVVPASQKEGFAKVVELFQGQTDFEAARVSLGVLGAISKITFWVEPMFKRSISFQIKPDDGIEDTIASFGKQHEFGDLTWYPVLKKVVFRVDDRANMTSRGDGIFRNGFQPVRASIVRKSREESERRQASRNVTEFCEHSRRHMDVSGGRGLLNDGKKFTGYPVVGLNHKMQTYGACQYAYENETNLRDPDRFVCDWDYNAYGTFYFHFSIGLPLSIITSFVQDVKKLAEKVPLKLCTFGLEMRYVKASQAYLGPKEDMVMTEFTAFRDRNPGNPTLFEDITEEIEQLMVLKYNGKPHFGKNRNVAFEDLGKKVTNLSKFLEVKNRMDPEGWFSSDWSDAVLGINGNVSTVKPGCALEGLCFCTEDAHCAPHKRYFCKPGTVYNEARVCTYQH